MYYGQQRQCEMCGEPIDRWARRDKRTCSATCRKQLSRRDDTINAAFHNAMSSLSTLRDLLKRQPVTAPMINPMLERLESEIRDLRRLRPDDDMKARIGMQYEIERRKV